MPDIITLETEAATYRPGEVAQLAESFGVDLSQAGRTCRAVPDRLRGSVMETARLLTLVRAGDARARLTLSEALSTSDLIKWSTGVVIDREILAKYAGLTMDWTNWAARKTVRNFEKKYFGASAIAQQVLPVVPEGTEYPTIGGVSLEEFSIQVAKRGARAAWTWEAKINQDIEQLLGIVDGFPEAAKNTENQLALGLVANTTTGAPNAAFFKDADGVDNIGTGDLNETNLEFVINLLNQTRKDKDGRIIQPNRLTLMVGKALERKAKYLLASVITERTIGGVTYKSENTLAGDVDLYVNPELPGGAWYVFESPGSAKRPAFLMGFLAGHESPEVRYKANGGNRLGGGAVGVDDGSFDDDTTEYRVRHILGGTQGFRTFTFASDGLTGVTA